MVILRGRASFPHPAMARAYCDELRRRILQADAQEEGSEAGLARRFCVSVSYVKKLRRQLRHTGKMERVAHPPGRQPKFTEPVREQLRRWLEQQPDLTLAERQEQLRPSRRAYRCVCLPCGGAAQNRAAS